MHLSLPPLSCEDSAPADDGDEAISHDEVGPVPGVDPAPWPAAHDAVPNLQFGEVSSPMAMSQNLADFMNALTNRHSQSRGRGHMLQQQAMLSNTARFGEHTSVPEAGYSIRPPCVVHPSNVLAPSRCGAFISASPIPSRGRQ